MKSKEEFVFIKMRSSLNIFVLVLILINSLYIKVLALNENSVNTTSPHYDNELINNTNDSVMLPGSNMTFGSSLDNAKMHLMEAIMDIEDNNIDGALMQLNMTSNYIKMHEYEMADMMLMINKKLK
jgi:CBS-domain-containing membrane protein